MHGIAVVGHQHFLLADQGPLVAIRRTIVGVHHIRRGQATGVRLHRVIGQRRQAADAPVTGTVAPGPAGREYLVQRILHHQRGTGQLRGRRDLVAVVQQGVVHILDGHAVAVIDVIDVAVTLDQVALAVDYHRLVVDEGRLVALVVQDVVPDHFHTVLRGREGNPRHGARYAVAIGNQLGPLGIGPGGIVDTLRIGGA